MSAITICGGFEVHDQVVTPAAWSVSTTSVTVTGRPAASSTANSARRNVRPEIGSSSITGTGHGEMLRSANILSSSVPGPRSRFVRRHWAHRPGGQPRRRPDNLLQFTSFRFPTTPNRRCQLPPGAQQLYEAHGFSSRWQNRRPVLGGSAIGRRDRADSQRGANLKEVNQRSHGDGPHAGGIGAAQGRMAFNAAMAEPRAPAMSRSDTTRNSATSRCSTRNAVCCLTASRNQSRKCGSASTTPPPTK